MSPTAGILWVMSSSQNARTVGGTTLRGWGDSSSLHPAIRNRMATLSGQPASSSVRGTCCWLFLQVILDQLSSSPLLTCSQGNDGVLKRCQDKGELARQLRFSANLSVSWKHDVVPCPSSMTQMTCICLWAFQRWNWSRMLQGFWPLSLFIQPYLWLPLKNRNNGFD